MAKSIDPKNKDLEQDILNEGKAAGTGAASPEVDQNKLKEQVANLGSQANASAETNLEAEKPNKVAEPPAGRLATPLETAVHNFSQLHPTDKVQFLKDHGLTEVQDETDYTMPDYLKENPPANQEEIDAIATFLEGYRNRPTHEEKAKKQEEDTETALVKKYGKGYVHARKGSQEQYFSAITWQRIGGNKNQDGWREVVKTPPEVKDMSKAGS